MKNKPSVKNRICPKASALKAVIFDFDGVIVDSMPYHFISWFEAMRPYGVRVGCFDVYCREGERWDKSVRDFLARKNIKPSRELLDKIFSLRRRIFKKRSTGIRFFNNAIEILRELKKRGYKLALVSGTPSGEIKRMLPAGIHSLFDVIVTGDKVKHGKPHPEPYETALRHLDLPAGECLVVENAPLGITSAAGAGLFCVAVSTSLPAEYLRKADIIIGDISGVLPIIEEKSAGRCSIGPGCCSGREMRQGCCRKTGLKVRSKSKS